MQSDIRRIMQYFKGRDEVAALYLFGSAVEGRETPESDIDLAVLVDEDKLKRKNYEALKRRYYGVSPRFSLRPVDIVIMNTAPPYLSHRIIKTGTVLFDKSRRQRVRFTARAITDYLDFRPVEELCLKNVTKRFGGKSVGR